MRLRSGLAAIAVLLAVSVPAAQPQLVKVSVPKANVRSEPSDKAPILQQVTPQDVIEYRETQGDWFKILLPPNPSLGGARVEAFISKKVAKLGPAPAPSAAPATPAAPAAPPPPRIDTHALNVFLG